MSILGSRGGQLLAQCGSWARRARGSKQEDYERLKCSQAGLGGEKDYRKHLLKVLCFVRYDNVFKSTVQVYNVDHTIFLGRAGIKHSQELTSYAFFVHGVPSHHPRNSF